ncbi:conserved unknown protein [Ectocarpus siliculosus]|uniref:Uncharacterized protein n=1 Tax=Ectocarpus siliculosus TaxID=2880 RepID=D8LSH0_ECTSI|nr:conserved unknown protein [Ectocarpus siliculosus]|eukprot:CBN75227.1 conserved unknown protein [Ectocarpus siliculosus]
MSGMAEPVGCNTVGTVSFLFGLVGGTGSSIVIKMLYQMSSTDVAGNERHFEKPLFLTFIMFVAMSAALPIYYVQQLLKAPEDRPPKVPGRVLGWLVVPSIFDLAGTNFAQIGLLFTTVSYFQLLRCTVIVVTAFLKAFVLNQRLAAYMWWGVAINIVAMVLVSVTNFIAPEDAQPDGANNPALGAFFILLSCIVQGSQYIFEEKVMAVDNAPPLVVIGMEGLWGTLIMLVIFPIAAALPGRDLGSIENTQDSFYMVSQSNTIQLMLLIFFVTITTYNIFCIYVTAYLSAIWHAILDNFRPVSVWSTDLVIYYMITNGSFGEAWTQYSWLQFSGMM